MTSRWRIRDCDVAAADRLASELKLPRVAARLLVQRGYSEAAEAARFLSPSLDHLHSPWLMRGMRQAVDRIRSAVANGEDMLIYGDYDVDGTVAVVILKTAIELLNIDGKRAQCDFHVPHRIREGYGIREDRIEAAAAAGVKLVISVDTGIRAFDAAEAAARLGIDLIVTDHHLPDGDGIPRALAVLNPNQAGCDYPCKSLCGAGVAFKIAQALFESESANMDAQRRLALTRSFMKMAAIATVADCVPLRDENRIIAKLGLDELRRPVNAGLRALFSLCKLAPQANAAKKPLRASDVGFRIGPRINAAGRMDVASDVIELFTSNDEVRAREIAARLDRLNSERQAAEKTIVADITARLDDDETLRDSFCLVLDGDGWHRGVVGIAASRVVEKTCRPALVISRDPETGEAHGSGRSIPAFHLLHALQSVEHLFTRFGGHAHAVGFALPCDNIAPLRDALDAYTRTKLTPADFVPTLEADLEIGFDEITHDLLDSVSRLQPFGIDNEEPLFVARAAKLLANPTALKDVHAKMRVTQPGTRAFDALAWRMNERVLQEQLRAGDSIDIAFRISQNEHPDFGGLQLEVEDWSSVAAANAARSA